MKKLIIGNWKMNPQSKKEAEIIFKGIVSTAQKQKNADVVICPPYPFLSIFQKTKFSKISIGAQDVSVEQSGPYTGEVSTKMLTSVGVSYVIVGHSERRAMGDTNQIVNKKIINALKAKIIPILCIGERHRDSSGEYLKFIKHQLHECLANIPKPQVSKIIIAYEPIWAIGEKAQREATPEEFTEIKIFIRKIIFDIYNSKLAHNVMVLYGGSVHPENSAEFLVDADGLLVGRDSLIPKKFDLIIKSVK
ncbi:MAG: triose-phosphate isomerase [Patescibacteria group bacterium]|nr:triose-phosphate isomerase [Patescibacteria group bacterium]